MKNVKSAFIVYGSSQSIGSDITTLIPLTGSPQQDQSSVFINNSTSFGIKYLDHLPSGPQGLLHNMTIISKLQFL